MSGTCVTVGLRCFNPRSPRGERLGCVQITHDVNMFQSTLPAWGATGAAAVGIVFGEVSIHAPRVGSDGNSQESNVGIAEFQSTLPAWGATGYDTGFGPVQTFQSTLPAWGATLQRSTRSMLLQVSIHAPRVGSDQKDAMTKTQYRVSIHAPRVGSD